MFQTSPQPRTLTCLVADDHRALVKLLASTLEDRGLSVVGRVCDGDEALARILARRPDVAILDLHMPGLPAWQVVQRVAAEAPETAILIYTGNSGEAFVEEALARGARGVVQKECSLDELLQAIEVVAAGGIYVDPFRDASHAGADAEVRAMGLTRRERDALQLLAEGLRDSEIANRLAVAPEVVRASVRSAMAKLEASTRTGAVAQAVRLGLIA